MFVPQVCKENKQIKRKPHKILAWFPFVEYFKEYAIIKVSFQTFLIFKQLDDIYYRLFSSINCDLYKWENELYML